MSIKIKDAPTTSVTSTLRIPVGNVGDNEAHTITPSTLKTWILNGSSGGSGGIRWADLVDRPNFIDTASLKLVNGQSLVGEGNLIIEADTVKWDKVVGKTTIPTKTSELINDEMFIKASKASSDYQSKLVSGENIATVNGYNLLSGGNIVIEGGEGSVETVDKDATLSWSTRTELATVNGDSIHVTLPANPNTDEKVRQIPTTTNLEYNVLFTGNTGSVQEDNHIRFGNTENKKVTINPSTGVITAPGFKVRKNDGTIESSPKIVLANGSEINAPSNANTYLKYNGSSFEWGSVSGTGYTDTTDANAIVNIEIIGNQVVRCTNANITNINFTYGSGYLSGSSRELTSTVYFTCPKSAPDFSFPNDSHIYGDFENMVSDQQYIISIQGNNFILTPSMVNWNDISEKPNVQIEPSVIEIGGTDDGTGVREITIDELQPNTIYKCTFATRVVVKAVANGCGSGHYPTRIYMERGNVPAGTEEVMYIQMPEAWKVIGMNDTSLFRQGGNFNTFYVEFRMGYAESVGNNYSV
mgnify:CR=1 FL=1